MKNKKIIIAGGTGFIGQEMAKYFHTENEIIILTRQIQHSKNNRNSDNHGILKSANIKYVKWDGMNAGDWTHELEGADVIINLAGKSVNCRYSRKNKQEILVSRVNAVMALGAAIRSCANPAKIWINAGSATIYRHAEDKPQDEYNGEYHNDFSVQVCKCWETSFHEQTVPQTRKVNLRMAITLGTGGVLLPYFKLLKFGLGGKQGTGRQMFSWIHIEDTCRLIEWITENEKITGTFNCCSPNPVTNQKFMKELRISTSKNFGLPAFNWILKTGAFLIGTDTELVLKSRWVHPTKLIEKGFSFKYPTLPNALSEIISRVPPKQFRIF